MKLKAILFLAFKDLMKHKRLLAVLSLALMLAVANSVLSGGMLKGFTKTITSNIVETVTGHVGISPREGTSWFQDADKILDRALELPQVKAATKRVRASGLLGAVESDFRTVSVLGLDSETEPEASTIKEKMVSGGFLTGAKGEAIIPKQFADFTGLGLGDSLEIDVGDGRILRATVTGIADIGSFGAVGTVLVNIEELREVMKLQNGETNSIVVRLFEENDAVAVKAALLQEGIQDNVVSWTEVLGAVQQVMQTWEAIFSIITTVAIIAASAGVAVMIYINILNRTKIIGTLKAIGASNDFIMLTFISQAIIIAFIGIAIGLAVSTLGAALLSSIKISLGPGTLQFIMDWGIAFNTALTAFLFIVIASTYPAWRASKLEVVEALRYE